MGGSFDIGGALESFTGALEGLSDAFSGEEGKKLEHIHKALEEIKNGVGDLATLQAAFDKEFPEVTRNEAMNEKLQGIVDEIKREVVRQSPEAVALDQYANQILQIAPKKPGLKDRLREWGKNDFFKNFVESLKDDLDKNKLGWIGKTLAMYVISAVESPESQSTDSTTTTPGSSAAQAAPVVENGSGEPAPANEQAPVNAPPANPESPTEEKINTFKASLAEKLKDKGVDLTVAQLMRAETGEIEDATTREGLPEAELPALRTEIAHQYLQENPPEGLTIKVINNQLEVKVGDKSPRYFSVDERKREDGSTVNVLTEGNKSVEWNGPLAELPTVIQQLDALPA